MFPHRIVASASYKFNYLKHGATTIGLFYEGQAGSNPFSYVVNGDLNGDGNGSSDLMYIPKRGSDVNFTSYTATVNGIGYTYTAQQQAAALEQFINNSPYLSKHRGEYADRNAAFLLHGITVLMQTSFRISISIQVAQNTLYS